MTRSASDVLADLAALASRQARLYDELAAVRPSECLAPAPAPPPPSASEYLNTREAAELLGVSARTLEGLRAAGRGPVHVRIGRVVRYPREGLTAVRSPSAAPPPVPSGGTSFPRSR
jgi:hypothetical protein